MKNKTQELITLINEGWDMEIIMMMMGIDDKELFELMMEIKRYAETPTITSTPTPIIKVTFVTQNMRSEMVGNFSVNLN